MIYFSSKKAVSFFYYTAFEIIQKLCRLLALGMSLLQAVKSLSYLDTVRLSPM